MIEKKFNILTDLDTVFDTRGGLLGKLDKQLLLAVVKDGSYDSRVIDEFGYLPSSVFKALYKKRDKKVLKNSAPARILDWIQETYINSYVISKMNDLGAPTLFINTYPYNLLPVEEEVILKGFKNTLPLVENIVLKNFKPSETDIQWLKDSIKTIVMYSGAALFETVFATRRVSVGELSDISLNVPSIMDTNPKLTNESLDKFLEDTEKQMGPLIKLSYLAAGEFSFIF